jgi:hypothetical protein
MPRESTDIDCGNEYGKEAPLVSPQGWMLEIGCGSVVPVPRRFATNLRVLATDIDPAVEALLPKPEYVPVRCDGRHLPLVAHSVEHVVARNVFGDVGLGHTVEDAVGMAHEEYASLLEEVRRSGELWRLDAVRSRIRDSSAAAVQTKLALLAEAGRVLRRHGSVVVIETMTPRYAEKFFAAVFRRQVGRQPDQAAGIAAEFRIIAVDGHARRRRYCTDAELADPKLRVWILERRVAPGRGRRPPRRPS